MLASSNPVKEGDDLTLTCQASGGNPTTYYYEWFYNNNKVPKEESRSYTVTAIKYTQNGTYQCKASNDGGYASADVTIDVQCKFF